MHTPYLEPHQTRQHEPTPYEQKLAGAIEEIFGTGVHDLAGLAAGLQERGLAAPDGGRWTTESFRAQMQKLGA